MFFIRNCVVLVSKLLQHMTKCKHKWPPVTLECLTWNFRSFWIPVRFPGSEQDHCLSVCMNLCIYACMHLCVCLFIRPSLYIHPSTNPSPRQFIHPSTRAAVRPFVFLFVYRTSRHVVEYTKHSTFTATCNFIRFLFSI